MVKEEKSYLTAEYVDEQTTVMILGEHMPILFELLSNYIKKYGGNVITTFDTHTSVDYLLIFDQPYKIKKYLSCVKPGGKVLQVLSDMFQKQHAVSIDTYHLKPTKTYKSHVLVRKLLSKLYTAKEYYPAIHTKTEKSNNNKIREVNKNRLSFPHVSFKT